MEPLAKGCTSESLLKRRLHATRIDYSLGEVAWVSCTENQVLSHTTKRHFRNADAQHQGQNEEAMTLPPGWESGTDASTGRTYCECVCVHLCCEV